MILVVTVGGSCQPLVTAINDYRPNFVCFIASIGSKGSRKTVDDPGKPCKQFGKDDMPSIVTQTGITPDKYQVVELTDPDSLQECYGAARAILTELTNRFPAQERVVDYTGGTKSMSIGLALGALESDWKLSLVKGTRSDLIRVTDGTESAGLVNAWEVRARQQMEEARRLFNDYNYIAAEAVILSTLQSNPLSTSLQETLRRWRSFTRGLDAWDRFDHERAYQVLESFAGEMTPNFLFLKRLLGKMQGSTGYEPVMDLLLNAQRRAFAGRYDDAVARLYRATELLAQTRLSKRNPSIDSGRVDIQALPLALQAEYENLRDETGRIRLGLRQDYELLAKMKDPIGLIYDNHAKRLLSSLEKRNHSILAHGNQPLNRNDYIEVERIFTDFILLALQEIKIPIDTPQFPILSGDTLQARK